VLPRGLHCPERRPARAPGRSGSGSSIRPPPLDPEIDALWNLIQTEFHDNQGAIVAVLARKKALKRGLGVAQATDIPWTLNHPDVWHNLVDLRGWSPDEFERWFGDISCAQLLP
jgi:hypothetical protein